MPFPRAVLFDLDGTLLDSIDLILDSYAHTFAQFDLAAPTREAMLADIGVPLWVVFERLGADRERVHEMIAAYRDFNLLHHDARVAEFPGVADMLQRVRARGCLTALVTSKNRHGALRGLRAMGLFDAIDVVVGADDVARPKPDSEPVTFALTRLGVRPAEAVFVGDSVHDIASGRAACVRTVAAAWGAMALDSLRAAGADMLIEHPRELMAWLDGGVNRASATRHGRVTP